MRSFSVVLFCVLGILAAPLSTLASTITGGGATEVSSHVASSMAGPDAAADEPGQRRGQDSGNGNGNSGGGAAGGAAPAVAAGMPLVDLGGLPMMLVSPPQFYALAPHAKLRSLAGDQGDNGGNVGPQVGNGNGGLANLGGVGSAPQAVPEPFALLLAGPALALALRRRIRR